MLVLALVCKFDRITIASLRASGLVSVFIMRQTLRDGADSVLFLVVDLTPLYPASVHEALPFLNDIRRWYIAQHADPLFISPPAWFTLYTWMELLYHLPWSIWAVGALIRGH